MFFLRNKVLFRAEKELPDPEVLKLRFRRRVVLLTMLGAFYLLSIPVLREQIPALETHKNARKFTELLQNTRYLAASMRRPLVLTMEKTESKNWTRATKASYKDCSQEASGPLEIFPPMPVEWKIIYLAENGRQGIDEREVKEICFHPIYGVYVNGEPLNNGLLQVLIQPQEDQKQNNFDRTQRISIQNFGSEIYLEPSNT